MTDHYWLADRVMHNYAVEARGISADDVVAVLRALADYELWGHARWDEAPRRLAACRLMHRIADEIRVQAEGRGPE